MYGPIYSLIKCDIVNPWNRVLMRVKLTFNNEIVSQCQYYTGFYYSVEVLARECKAKFMNLLLMCLCFLVTLNGILCEIGLNT